MLVYIIANMKINFIRHEKVVNKTRFVINRFNHIFYRIVVAPSNVMVSFSVKPEFCKGVTTNLGLGSMLM